MKKVLVMIAIVMAITISSCKKAVNDQITDSVTTEKVDTVQVDTTTVDTVTVDTIQ